MNARNRLENIAPFYLSRDDQHRNLFEIWEGGEGRGDSVTPSTYSAEYRDWIRDRLLGTLDSTGATGLLSLGCGNAMVEAEIARKGFRVLAVDALPEAVDLARAKGVPAECGDVEEWAPRVSWPVVYMDGLAGHLYRSGDGLVPVLSRIRSWLAPNQPGGVATLIISNDAPKDGSQAQAAPGVSDFHWLSAGYLRDEAVAACFEDVVTAEFVYRRPQSGDRTRAVVHAHVHA
jgi:SAM-dependent methyltransferase